MKKLFSVILFVVMFMFSVMVCNVSAANIQFKAAKGTATIDCVKDDAYLAADATPVEFGATDDTASGKVWAIWDDTALYFYAEISDKTLSTAAHADDTVWQRDSVEFYLDFTNAQEDTDITTIDAGQFTCGLAYPNGEVWGGMGGHWDSFHDQCSYKTKAVDGGWVCEAKIVFGDYKPATNNVIGYTVAINDDTDDTDGRENQIMVSDGQTSAWSTTGSAYDRLVLSDAVYTPPVVETEAPVTEAAAVETAAPAAVQTADIFGAAVVITLISLAGVVISKKK
jgi:Domain of unknown function (DUF1083).